MNANQNTAGSILRVPVFDFFRNVTGVHLYRFLPVKKWTSISVPDVGYQGRARLSIDSGLVFMFGDLLALHLTKDIYIGDNFVCIYLFHVLWSPVNSLPPYLSDKSSFPIRLALTFDSSLLPQAHRNQAPRHVLREAAQRRGRSTFPVTAPDVCIHANNERSSLLLFLKLPQSRHLSPKSSVWGLTPVRRDHILQTHGFQTLLLVMARVCSSSGLRLVAMHQSYVL
jgi:hypothetical protein